MFRIRKWDDVREQRPSIGVTFWMFRRVYVCARVCMCVCVRELLLSVDSVNDAIPQLLFVCCFELPLMEYA